MDSNTAPDSSQPLHGKESVDDSKIGGKKGRGPSKLMLVSGQQNPKVLERNEFGQPIGDNSAKYASFLGCMVKEFVPYTLDGWNDVDEDLKSKMWSCLQLHFNVEEWEKKTIFQKLGKLWRDRKSRLQILIREVNTGQAASRDLSLLKPEFMDQNQWEIFVKKTLSLSFQVASGGISSGIGNDIDINGAKQFQTKLKNVNSEVVHDNHKCKLLHWCGEGVVAEGRVASTDSKAKVYHIPLGGSCWKSHPATIGLRNKEFPHLDDLMFVWGKDHATGANAETPADAVEEINLCDEEVDTSNAEIFAECYKEKADDALDDLVGEIYKYVIAVTETNEEMKGISTYFKKQTESGDRKMKIYDELIKLSEFSEQEIMDVGEHILKDEHKIDNFFALPKAFRRKYVIKQLNEIHPK
ncbi:hypothetical protein ZIOFF_067990 [Zingiber officinale]|uniref:Uncharacterized protein n=1 Tax=Zingiber officinale TaxID=94328 RepID=A0A8J5CGG6_ZINOF|nr:hypothetical protein ZIOFF_067990 [Zingiber officinale]